MNALAFYLFRDQDCLGRILRGRTITAELSLETFAKLSTGEKWKQLSRIGGREGFDPSRAPYQNFTYLFKFRDDLVHDKPIAYGSARAKKRYNRKLPDPALGFLDLRHAMFAAVTYWSMVESITAQLDLAPEDFHGHYVLAPWASADILERLEELTTRYASAFPEPA